MVKEFKYSKDFAEEDQPKKSTAKVATVSEEDQKIAEIQAKIEDGKPVLAREEAKAKGKIAKMANWE